MIFNKVVYKLLNKTLPVQFFNTIFNDLISLFLSFQNKFTRCKEIIYKSKSCRAAEFSKFYKFSMERKAGLASDAGGSLTGVLGSEIPSSSLIVIGFCTDPSSKERGSRRLVEPQTLSQESRGSSFPHAESLPPSFALFQVGSM